MHINPSPTEEEVEWLRQLPVTGQGRGPSTFATYARAIELRQFKQMTVNAIGVEMQSTEAGASRRIRVGEALIERHRRGEL